LADPTEITNVGGEGVASEVTLANLLAVTEQMAKKAGIDPKDVNKKLSNLAKSTDDTIKVSSKNRDALKDNTKAVKQSSLAYKSLSLSAAGLAGILGSVARSGTEMAKAFVAGEKSLTGFVQHLPLIGNSLSILTGLFDNSFVAFQNVAMSGAAFNNSLTELRSSAAESRLALDQYTSFIGSNATALAELGGTATAGAKAIKAMIKTLGPSGLENDLLNMGFSFEDINEAMLEYAHLTRAGNRLNRLDQQQTRELAEGAAEYAKHQQVLAKLAGEEAKTAQEEIKRQMQDIAYQQKLATMGREEQAKVMALMNEALLTGSQGAVDALKSEFLGMPPLTEDAALYTATMQNQMGILTSRLQEAQDESVSQAQFNTQQAALIADMLEANANSAKEFKPLLSAAAAGLEGDANRISGFLTTPISFANFIDAETKEYSRAMALRDGVRALEEQNNRDSTTNSIATFIAYVADLQAKFETNIVKPIMETIAPALKAFGEALGPDRDAEGNAIEGTGLAHYITVVGTAITEDLQPAIDEFVKKFKEDPMGTIKEYFNLAIEGLGGLIRDAILGENGLLNSAFDAIKEGITTWWNNPENGFEKAMVAGAAALFVAGGPLAMAFIAGAGGLFRLARGAMRPRPGAAPRTGATVGRDPRTGRFTSLRNAPDVPASGARRAAQMAARGAKFIPGVGWVLAGAMGIFDGVSGYNADPNAGFLESASNAGESIINGLTFGLFGRSSDEIAADAGASGGSVSATPTMNTPSVTSNIDALNSLDADSVRQYTTAMERLVEVLGDLNEELAPSQNSRGRGRNATNAGSVLSGSGLGMGSEQLNTTMQSIYLVLQEMRDLDIRVANNTSRITSGNLAQGGVSSGAN